MKIDLGRPNPKQYKFLHDEHRHVAFGGARGGGKSHAIRTKAILLAAEYPGITIMIIRRTYPELRANHIEPLTKLLQIGKPDTPIKYNDSHKEIIWPNGSKIRFGYCNSNSDIHRYQGMEVDVLFLDEATQLEEDWIKAFQACVRGVNEFPKRIYYTCNPGGKSHAYIKRLFVDKQYLPGEHPEDYSFTQSLVWDNKVLMESDPDYIRMLEAQPEQRRKAWMDGDWNVFEGQVFEEFRNDPAHYEDRIWTHVIDEFDIPRDWYIYRGYDHGYAKPFSVGWYAVDRQGVIYRIRELYGCTREANKGVQWNIREIAEHIKEIENTDPLLKGKKIRGIADPAIWAKGSNGENGESIEDMFNRFGIYNNKGDHTRMAGLMQCHWRLAFDEEGFPMFYVFNTCKNFIRTIPTLIYDEHNVEDIDSDGEDHIYDEWRYICMEMPITPRKAYKPQPVYNDPLNLYTKEGKWKLQ